VATADRHIHLGPDVADPADRLHQRRHLLFGRRVTPLCVRRRPGRGHQRFVGLDQVAVDFLGHERHEGMQQFHGRSQHFIQHILGHEPAAAAAIVQAGFSQLDVPVAERLPEERVDFRQRHAQVVMIQVPAHFLDDVLQPGQDPAVLQRELIRPDRGKIHLVVEIHDREAERVPDLVDEVAASFDFLKGKALVVARRVAGHQSVPERVGSILVDDFQRIDAVAE